MELEGDTIVARLKTGPLLLKTGSFCLADRSRPGGSPRKGINRDLKPGNMMMAKSGIKVLDFGLAKSGADDAVTDAGRWRSANRWWSAGCFRRDSVVRRPTGAGIARACSWCPSKDISNPFRTKDGKRTASTPVERTPGGRLEVLIAFGGGEIRGALQDGDGVPMPNRNVHSSRTHPDSTASKSRPDQDGRYRYSQIRPEVYWLFAVERPGGAALEQLWDVTRVSPAELQ